MGGTGRVVFYSDKQVHAPVSLVRGVVGPVPLTEAEAERRRATLDLVDQQVAVALDDALAGDGERWDAVDVVLLSGP